jgi:MFS family permease
MLAVVLGSMTGGLFNTRIGYYTPIAILGSCVMSVGAGLLTTFQVDTGAGKWIGYQIIYGIGFGWCFQVPNLAAQTVLAKKLVPVGLALMLFGSVLGAAVFVSVGENVLSNQLVQRLSNIPGFDTSQVTSSGATSLIDSLSPSDRETGLADYNEALRRVFIVGLIPSCLSVLGTFALEWRSVKKKPEASPVAEASDDVKEKKVVEVTE